MPATSNMLHGWILKCDIAKFFYSINHEVLKDIVDYYFPNSYTTWLNHLFIDSTNGFGLPLGNQVAQVYALMMLDCIDHTLEDGEVCMGVYNNREKEWWTRKQEGERWYTNKHNVIAWQPLPEPYKEEKKC